MLGTVVQRGLSVAVASVENDTRLDVRVRVEIAATFELRSGPADAPPSAKLKSLYFQPLLSASGQVVGVLALANRISGAEVGPFTQADEALVAALAPLIGTCLVATSLHADAVGERAARERAITTRQQLLSVQHSCLRIDTSWSDLCARVREHASVLVGATGADLFLCADGGRELISTLTVAPDLNAAPDLNVLEGGEEEKSVNFKVEWLLQANESDAITLAARAVHSSATAIANEPGTLEHSLSMAANEFGMSPLADELALASGSAPFRPSNAGPSPLVGASSGASSLQRQSRTVTRRPSLSSSFKGGTSKPARFAVMLHSATPGENGSHPLKVGVLVVERALPFGKAEVELFSELAQHLGATVEMHRARWETLARLERAHAHAGRHALLLQAARASLRTYATYDGCFEVAHAMAPSLGASELNLYLVRRVDSHDSQAVPFAVGTPVLFSRMPAAEERQSAQVAGRDTPQLRDAYALVSGILGHVASTGQTVCTEDAQIHPHFSAQVDELSVRFGGREATSLLVVPVHDSMRRVVGVLQCAGKRTLARAPDAPELPRAFSHGEGEASFGSEDADFLQVFAHQLGLQLQQVQAHATAGMQVESVQEASIRLQGMARDAADASLAASRQDLSQGLECIFKREPAAAKELLHPLNASKLIAAEWMAHTFERPVSRARTVPLALPPVGMHGMRQSGVGARLRTPGLRVGRPAVPAESAAHSGGRSPSASASAKVVADVSPRQAQRLPIRVGSALAGGWPNAADDEEAVWQGVFKDIRSL